MNRGDREMISIMFGVGVLFLIFLLMVFARCRKSDVDGISVKIRISIHVKSGCYLLENPDTAPVSFGVILFIALLQLQMH